MTKREPPRILPILSIIPLGIAVTAAMNGCVRQDGAQPADLVLEGGPIYTANGAQEIVEAIAIDDGKIVYIGDSLGAGPYKGDDTSVIDLANRAVLPGFHDLSMHAVEAMDIEVCDLNGAPLSYTELSSAIADCDASLSRDDGTWLVAINWRDDAPAGRGAFRTVKEALDASVNTAIIGQADNQDTNETDGNNALETPVLLINASKDVFAANTPALARATTSNGDVVGFSKDSLKDAFADLANGVTTDRRGAPTGMITSREALAAMGAGEKLDPTWDARLREPQKLIATLAPLGFTTFLETIKDRREFDLYDALLRDDALLARAILANEFAPDDYANESGEIDFDRLMLDANRNRVRYAGERLIKADILSLAFDGPLRGDPMPAEGAPRLPTAAITQNFRQPIFRLEAPEQSEATSEAEAPIDGASDGENDAPIPVLSIGGYVDLQKDDCRTARRTDFNERDRQAYRRATGHDPAQCVISNGALLTSEETASSLAARATAANFGVLFRAHGDRAAARALTAFEAVHPDAPRLHALLGGITLLPPDGAQRLAALNAFGITALAPPSDDETHISAFLPTLEQSSSTQGLPQLFPAAAIDAATTLAVGHATSDRNPFIAIAHALERASDRYPPHADEPNQSDRLTETMLSLEDMIDTYTINAARALRHDDETGALRVGKKADFIIIDRNIFALADHGDTQGLQNTRVLETWLQGEQVFIARDK